MPPLAIIAGIGLAIGAVGTVMSISAQNKQTKAMREANAAQRGQDSMKAARERIQAIRSARLSSGTIQQAAVNQGSEGSSAALGSLGSIQQQLGSGLSFLDGYNRLSDQASTAIGRANQYAVKAGTGKAIAGFGMEVFKSASSFGKGA